MSDRHDEIAERAPTYQGIWLLPGNDFFAIKWLRKGRPARNWSAKRRRQMRRVAR